MICSSVVLHVNDSSLNNLDLATSTTGSACFSGGGLGNGNLGLVDDVSDHLDVLLGDLDELADLSDDDGSLGSGIGSGSSDGGESHPVGAHGSVLSHADSIGGSSASDGGHSYGSSASDGIGA